jgi:hypothetical protein
MAQKHPHRYRDRAAAKRRKKTQEDKTLRKQRRVELREKREQQG